MISWYIIELINKTWIILGKFLSASDSLNCIENSKYEFKKHQIKYLGYKISDGTVLVDPSKTEAISTWLVPSCVRELQ